MTTAASDHGLNIALAGRLDDPEFAAAAKGFFDGLAYGHLVDQAEAGLRQSWGYYRKRQYAARKGWSSGVHGSVSAWRPIVREAIARVRATRVRAGYVGRTFKVAGLMDAAMKAVA